MFDDVSNKSLIDYYLNKFTQKLFEHWYFLNSTFYFNFDFNVCLHSEVLVSNHTILAQFCKDHHVGLVVVGPEVPLAAGMWTLTCWQSIVWVDFYMFFHSQRGCPLQVLWTTWQQLGSPALVLPPKLLSWRRAKAFPRPSWNVTASQRLATAPSLTPRRPATTSARQYSNCRVSVCKGKSEEDKLMLNHWFI